MKKVRVGKLEVQPGQLPRFVIVARHRNSPNTSRLQLIADSGSDLNIIGSTSLARHVKDGVDVKITTLQHALTAQQVKPSAELSFTQTASVTVQKTQDNMPSTLLFHVLTDDTQPLGIDGILGWPSLQDFQAFKPQPDTSTPSSQELVKASPSTAPVIAKLSPVPAKPATKTSQHDLTQLEELRRRFPPPTPAQLAEQAALNAREFEAMLNRLAEHEGAFEEPAVYHQLVSLFEENQEFFTEKLRRGDAIVDIPLPPDTATVPLEKIPRTYQRHLSKDDLEIMQAWAGNMWYQDRIEPVLHPQSPCPSPTHVVGSADNPRMVHNTMHLKHLVEIPNVQEPTPAEKLQRFQGMVLAAKTDMPQAFFALFANQHTSPLLTEITIGRTVWRLKVLLMGGPTSAAHVTDAVQRMFGDACYDWFIPTMDDFAMVVKNQPTLKDAQRALLQMWTKFFAIVRKHRIPLKPSKTVIYTQQLHYCGNIITPAGITRDPASIDALRSCELPTNGDQLANLYYGMKWCANFSPDIQNFQDVHDTLEAMYAKAGKRTSQSIRKYTLAEFNLPQQRAADMITVLHNLAVLAHRDPSQALILFCDASDFGSGAALLQVPPEDAQNLAFMAKGTARPLGFYGAKFNPTQQNYPTYQKEALSIVRALQTFKHIIQHDRVLVVTDNKAVSFLLQPDHDAIRTASEPGRTRMITWSSDVRQFNAAFMWKEGASNVIADFISRMCKGPMEVNDEFNDPVLDALARKYPRKPVPTKPMPPSTAKTARPNKTPPPTVATVRLQASLRTVTDPDWVAPSLAEISTICGVDGLLHPDTSTIAVKHGFQWNQNQQLYQRGQQVLVPNSKALHERLLATAHSNWGAHRGAQFTLEAIQPHLWWPTQEKDVAAHVAACIHCAVADRSSPRRPYGEIVRGHGVNEVLSADFVHVGDSIEDGPAKALLLTCTFSNFSMAFPCKTENTTVVIEALQQWNSLFGLPKLIVFDSSPAFKNKVVEAFAKTLGSQLHFTTPHAHGAHGRQERLNLRFNTHLRALLSEHQLNPNQWPKLLPAVMFALNHGKVNSLAKYAPVEVFTGLSAQHPITTIMQEEKPVRIDAQFPNHAEHITELRKTKAAVAVTVEQEHSHRTKAIAARRAAAHAVVAPVFQKGDIVLVKKAATAHKNDPAWQLATILAPAHKKHKQIWEVQFASSDKKRRKIALIHADRIKPTKLTSTNKTPEYAGLVDYLEDKKYTVEAIQDMRFNAAKKQMELQIQWEGYADSTWEPITEINKDIPDMVRDFLEAGSSGPKLIHQARTVLGI